MKPFVALCILGLARAHAQIELPEYLAPNPAEENRPDSTIPPEERRHVDDTGDAETDPAEEDDSPEQWLRRMQGHNIQVVIDEPAPEDGDGPTAREIEAFYLGGPEEVTLTIADRRGDVVKSTIPNQTLLVVTDFGELPVRLHEIRKGTATGEKNAFRFELAGGDVLEGRLPDLHFWMKRMDGSERMISGREIRHLAVGRD